jgi:Spy/CpxP family protein refolding chaperone
MKIRTVVYVLFTGAASLALSAPASAQPHPPNWRPAPPTGEHHEPGHDDHRDAPPPPEHHEAHESEAQIRARVQAEQAQKFAQREAARKDARAWEASREQRAAQDRNETATTWGDIAEEADAKAELATHAERMAQLNRILDVANDQHDASLTARTNAVIQREISRDIRVLQAVRARVGR